MHPFNVKSFSDNLYNADNNSILDQYIYFEANYISTVIADTAKKQIMQLNVISTDGINFLNLSYDELKAIVPLKEELNKKFRERKVIINSPHISLVPESLLNVVETNAYYKLNQKELPHSQILYCKMHVQQTACIFNVRNELMKLIRFNMPMVDVYHSALLFIKAIESQAFDNAGSKLHLHLHPGYFELLNFDQQIRFYNCFHFESDTEIVYFILSVAEQLQINHGCDVVLYGNNSNLSELHNLLSKYVRSVQYGIKPRNFAYPVSFKQIEGFQFFNESASLLCE